MQIRILVMSQNRKVFLLSVMSLFVSVCSMAGPLHIKAKIDGMTDSVDIHSAKDNRDGIHCIAKDGYIEVDYEVDHPMLVYLENPDIYRGKKGVQVFFVAMPDENLEIQGSVDCGYVLGGSHFYEGYNKVYQMFIGSRNRQNATWNKYDAFKNRDKTAEELARLRDNELQIERRNLQETLLSFIQRHSNDTYAATAIAYLDVELMQKGETLLSESVRHGIMKDYYLPLIEREEWRKESATLSKSVQAEGNLINNFTLEDVDGKMRSLSEFNGKYVVLDFWGSWCGVCIGGFPKMIEYQERYQDKLQIIGIDCNESKEKWKNAVARLNAPWLHLYNGKTAENNLMKKYAVSGFPTKILLDHNGRILRVFSGEGDDFYDYLDKLFK